MRSGLLVVLIGLCTFAKAAEKPKVEFKNSPAMAAPNGYTHAVVVSGGKMIFLSGQVGLNRQGEMVGKDDFHAQAVQVFENLKSALAAVGATPKDIVKLNYLVVGLNHDKLVALRQARDQYIDKEHPPASTLAGVAALFREDAMLEVEAVAVVPWRRPSRLEEGDPEICRRRFDRDECWVMASG